MANASSLWAQAYLQAICAHPHFSAAMGVAPLWLAHESSADSATQRGVAPLPAARVTIQMAAEMFPRMALIGHAGAGKTTLLRQLARVLAEAILAEETHIRRSGAVIPLPLYIELVGFKHNIETTLADAFNLGPTPSLGELTRQRPLLLLLDGLEELAPDVQLAGLSALAQTFTQLGTHARWITTCRPENLPLFRPWLGAVEVRSIRPLSPRDVVAFLERQRADALAGWIERADDLIALASRVRWLDVLAQLDLAPPPYSRGRLMAAWLASVLAATTAAHPALGSSEAALTALPILADALDKRRQNSLTLAEVDALRGATTSVSVQLLIRAGLLTCDTERRQVAFSHPALRSFAQALSLVQTQPDSWPAAIFTRAWNEMIVFAYSLCDDRESLLRRLLSNGAIQLAARCLIDTELRGDFEALLERSGALTPPLRVMLAEAFAAEGLTEAAREQLERAGMEGYDEAGLFGRLGELYSTAGQWNHARAAYEQALARDPEGTRYQQQLGIVYSRLGALDEAAAALQAVIKEQQRHSAEAAFELGHIYLNQGQFEQALAAYQQASASRPDEPAYHRGVAAALRCMGRLEAAELLLRDTLDHDDTDPLMHAELGRVYADTGRLDAAIACYARAITLRPDSAEYYYQIGQLRARMGDLSGARAALQRATELDPYDATLHYALGKACEDAGEQESAIAAYRYTARLDERNEACLRRLGALLRERGADAEAAQALQAALELRPDSAETHEELATLLWRQGQHDQALELYERAIMIAPREARYQYAISLAYRQLGRQQESMRHALRATELAPDDAAAHHAAATAAEALQDWDVALASYEQAMALEPGRPEYIRATGALYLKRGNRMRARALLAAALRYDRRNAATLQQVALLHAADAAWPRAIRALRRMMRVERSASVYDQLGRALMAAGHLSEARAAFEQALEITHGDPDMLFHYSKALDACGQSELAYDIARQSTRQAAGNATFQCHAGELALRLGRPREALAFFDQAVALDSTLPVAHVGRGQALLALDQPKAALPAARTALALDQNLAAAALLAGQAAIRLDRSKEACAALEQAIALDDTLGEAQALLRDLLDRIGERSGALIAGRRAAELAPRQVIHRLRLGELLIASDDLPAAIAELELALQLDPDMAAAHARLSQAYARLEIWQRALYHAERAVALDPDASDSHALLAQARAELGDHDGASTAYTTACKRAPDRAEWPYALGQLYRSRGNHQAALPFFRRATLIAPDHADYHYAVGRCLEALGDPDGAVEALECALQIAPQSHQWRAELAAIQAARGWYGEALAELNRAISVTPQNVQLWRMRAEMHLQLEQPGAAQADLIEALRQDPHDAQSCALLARALIARDQLETALDVAQRAVALAPNHPEYRRLLAQILRACGRRTEAADQLGRALRLGGAAECWAELADDCEALDLLDRAKEAWQHKIALTSGDPVAYYRYSCVLERYDELPLAIDSLRAAIHHDADFAAAHARLADVFVATAARRSSLRLVELGAERASTPAEDLQLVTFEAALESARRAIALQPDQSDYWRVLGALLRWRGAHDEAGHALQHACELDPSNHQAAFLQGQAALERDAMTAAVAAFTAASTARPSVAAYHGYLGIACRQQITLTSEPDELLGPEPGTQPALEGARPALLRAIELEPTNQRWWYELGLIEQLCGRHDTAIMAFDRALAAVAELTEHEASDDHYVFGEHAMPTDRLAETPNEFPTLRRQVLGRRALSLYITGRIAEARANQESALAQGSSEAHDHYLLGRIACEMNDFATARTALGTAAALDPRSAQTQFFLGRALLALGQAPEAVAALERAAELRPDHAETVALLSDAYSVQGRHERALTAATRALRLDSTVAEYYQRLASLYMISGRLNEARAALIKAMILRPDVAAWYAQMGELCQRLKMHSTALNAYTRAVQLAPDSADYLYALARLQAQQGRAAEARATLRQAVAHSPKHGGWHYELGQIEHQLGDDGAALTYYSTALQRAPDALVHWHALALAQRRLGKHEMARETLERALARFGADPTLHAATGALLAEQGEHAAVAWHYNIVVEHEPDVAEHWWRLGCARLEIDDTTGARVALEKSLELAPDTAEAHAGLAQLFAQQRDERATLAHIQRAVELMPNNLVYQTQLAEALTQLRRYEEAYDVLRRALDFAPGDPGALARFGEMALHIGRYSEALEAFDQAASIQPEEASYHFLAGKAHRRLKHYRRAIECYRRAVRLRPSYSEAIIELSTLGPLAFVAHHLRGVDQDAVA